jgi:hypothetical protein
LVSGAPADLVFGQPNFTANLCNQGGGGSLPTPGSLCSPQGVAVDSMGNLYVADRGNSRILVYFSPFTTDTIADRVVGQTDMTTSGCSNPSSTTASASSLCVPVGVALDGSDNLYVADMGNNRVVEYNTPLTTDTIADRVFGQLNFTTRGAASGAGGLNQPYAISVDGTGNMYVADFGNNRVLEYDTPLTTNTIADRVFGQPNFNSNVPNVGGVSASTLYNPSGVVIDSMNHLYVADRSNSRVLQYNFPLTTNTIADRVFGQTVFANVGCNRGGLTATSLCLPSSVAVDSSGDLWVVDFSNHRVLEYGH